MRSGRKLSAVLATAGLLLAFPLASSAIPIIQTFVFDAFCTDCAEAAGTATHVTAVTLKLQNYEVGDKFKRHHFYSFAYEGSNLVDDIFINRNEWLDGKKRKFKGRVPSDYELGDPFKFSLEFKAADRDDSLFSCTDLGWSVVKKKGACSKNNKFYFRMAADGEWKLGKPTKDQGGVNHLNGVPEPSGLALVALGLAAFGFCSKRAPSKPLAIL